MEYGTIEFASNVDDTKPYTYGQSFDEIIEKLVIDMPKISEWFHHNGFKAKPGKFYFLLSQFVEVLLRKRM